jgi:phosphoribosyl 1,2-cyclic phosphodiesterase
MALQTASLNSGSNGNCYYVGNRLEAVLVDVGISCREVEKRMLRLNLPLNRVKAIFISHEHIDHIRGVEVLSRKYRLPVYITPSTLRNSPAIELEEDLIRPYIANNPIAVGNMVVTAFKKNHDAAEPHSFIVEGNSITIGVFTDIGKVCEQLEYHFSLCHAAFLEANYDDEMLEKGAYPYHLKKRISGDKGHLSNAQALELFKKHKAPFLNHVFLSHLSRDNNSPELAHQLFSKHAGATKVVVASRYSETELFTITDNHNARATKVNAMQLSLFSS